MKRIIVEKRGETFHASIGSGHGFGAGKTIAEAIGDYVMHNPEQFDIEIVMPDQTDKRPDELFTVAQRQELIAAYVKATGREGEYQVCEHGFLWDSSGVSDVDFALTCNRLGIDIPT